MGRIRSLWLFLGLVLFAVSFYDVSADVIPSENECRPYIEKAIHELKNTESAAATEDESTEDNLTNNTGEDTTSIETTAAEDGDENDNDAQSVEEAQAGEDNQESLEGEADTETAENVTVEDNAESQEAEAEGDDKASVEDGDEENADEADNAAEESTEGAAEEDATQEETANDSQEDDAQKSQEEAEEAGEQETAEETGDDNDSQEQPDDAQDDGKSEENTAEAESAEVTETAEATQEEEQANESTEDAEKSEENAAEESVEEEKVRSKRSISDEATVEDNDSAQQDETANDSTEDDAQKSQEEAEGADDVEGSKEEAEEEEEQTTAEDVTSQEQAEVTDNSKEEEEATTAEESQENAAEDDAEKSQEEGDEAATDADGDSKEAEEEEEAAATDNDSTEEAEKSGEEGDNDDDDDEADDEEKSEETIVEEELTLEFEIPKNLRAREHITDLLGLDAKSSIKENALKKTGDVILKELKHIYDHAIKPLEQMYKYRDLSNRHYGDPEIFSKPLVLFMGPWSGGKSTILNYLTDNEYTPNSIRSGAEPSPAYFNILMHGDEPEVLDGTQLAADWTFSGLQKFGQGLMDRLRGQKLPSKLLERVNIVEIPGILEVRKQVSRFFPFNDACQWFIDRADIIFLVYDPSKLDVGPETEAILDQLKGREYQTRILLNKADQVKPEELLRVQSALIWNISPLMSSAQPPVMYTVSLWSHPFEQGAPVRLLQAQERALLGDLREAIDKRIENKIASARRFAVRIRNHAKMVDCYLTTYYNQKSLFSNKKQVSDKIIEHPQNYNIYEGLSTLTNISRYDLPDPEVYLDFFRLNPLYEFKKLSDTCTYFKGCPINKLDIAIAYDLPELVGKYKKLFEENYSKFLKEFDENCNQTEPEPPVKLR